MRNKHPFQYFATTFSGVSAFFCYEKSDFETSNVRSLDSHYRSINQMLVTLIQVSFFLPHNLLFITAFPWTFTFGTLSIFGRKVPQ